MVREILFRGFESTGIKRKWRFGSLVDVAMANTEESHYRIVEKLLDGVVYCPVVVESIGQFTGLTDKNGVKIFEGDYFKIDSVVCVVVYVDDGFKLIGNGFNAEALFAHCRDGLWGEVIGNVFENPELIGVQNE